MSAEHLTDERLKEIERWTESWDTPAADVLALVAEVRRLRAALIRYGSHLHLEGVVTCPATYDEACVCGLAEAVR